MYAVISTGGKQYRVCKGDLLRIEKIPGKVGASVDFDRILLYSDGENLNVGNPTLDDVKVSASIVQQDKAKKVIVFKYKRRKRFRRKRGHRQEFTAIKIDNISA